MKLTKLLNARRVFLKHTNDEMPVSLAYKFMKAIKASDNEEAFYNKKIEEIVGEFGATDDNGKLIKDNGNIVIKPDKIAECNEKVKELEDTEVNVELVTFTVEDLGDLKFTVKELFLLEDYIK